MTLNLLVIAFLIAMAVLWATQGGFSGMLHLLMVVVAGTLTLAIWEPLALTLLGVESIRPFAWGLAMLLPFAVLLTVLRMTCDKLVKGNVHLQGTVSQVVGGACGVGAGVLTAGMIIIGLGFLGGPTSLAGYQPYIVARDTGQIVPNPQGGDLWLSVDEWTVGFFNQLSQGGFAGGIFESTPLATHRPNLAREAAVFHLRYHDPNASIVTGPEGVRLDGVYTLPASERSELAEMPQPILDTLGDDLARDGNRVVVIETTWQQAAGAYDSDGTLRVAPTQVRLLTHSRQPDAPPAELHLPIGFGKLINPRTNQREFYSTRSGGIVYATSADLQEQPIAWLFVLPQSRELSAVFLRQLRFPIEDMEESAGQIIRLLGEPPAEEEDEEQEEETPRQTEEMPDFLQRTAQLPQSVSKNEVTNLSFAGPDNNLVASGKDQSRGRGAMGPDSRKVRADAVYAGSGDTHAIIRARLDANRARSMLGRAYQTAQQVATGLFLEDDFGQPWEPIGYVWDKNGPLELHFRPTQPFRSPSELPVSQMEDNHTLYLYFRVPRSRTIIGYQIGTESAEGLNIPVSTD